LVKEQIDALKDSFFIFASEAPKSDDFINSKIDQLEAKIERIMVMMKYN